MAGHGNHQDFIIHAMDSLWFSQNIMEKPELFSGAAAKAAPEPDVPAEENSSRSGVASRENLIHQSTEQGIQKTMKPDRKNRPELHRFTKKPTRRRLEMMRRCKSFSELEYEELQGFRDLGFTFNEDELSPYVRSMLPGLQMEEEKQDIIRPYLSEAWLVNRPDSPLLNVQIPPISTSSVANVKEHLRSWARTVAEVVKQNS